MSDARLIDRRDLVVGLDYGQFYLATAESEPEFVEEVLADALDGEGIAQSDGVLVVESPHQNNFAMPLTVELWDSEPEDDQADWQEAFEAHLDIGEAGLTYESPTVDLVEVDVPAGSYHALITGRGFIAVGWPGSTEPGDEWRIRLWPSTGPDRARRLRAYVPDQTAQVPSPPTTEEPSNPVLAALLGGGPPPLVYDEDGSEQRRQAAREAGARICRDLGGASGARPLSDGTTASLRIDMVVPREIDKLWELLAHLDITLASAPNVAAVGNEFAMSTYDLDEDGFVGPDGEIVCRWTSLRKPGHVWFDWRWQVNRHSTRTLPPMSPSVSELRFDLHDVTQHADAPLTLLRMWHIRLPPAWGADMYAIWLSKIDQWAYQSRPRTKRIR